nr:hypothetical protein [Escherichia coli]
MRKLRLMAQQSSLLPPPLRPVSPLWTFRGADVTPSRSICPG